ncbi:MAG: alpha/beta fold hydrolase [Methyloligellaceae bacterium]
MTVELAYKVYGEDRSGPDLPMVILHGLFGSSRNWTAVANRLSEQRPVYALDLRNHGASPWSEDMGYEDMASDVAAFVNGRDLGPIILIGHSMGGKTAMATALGNPDLIAQLVVVDIAPVDYAPDLRAFTQAMLAVDLASASTRSDIDGELKGPVPDPGVRAFLLQNVAAHDGAFAWRINLPVIDKELERLSRFPQALVESSYAGPTAFISGGQSDYVQPSHHDAIRDVFPAASFEAIPGAGHWVHAEAPELFIQSVERYLVGPTQTCG